VPLRSPVQSRLRRSCRPLSHLSAQFCRERPGPVGMTRRRRCAPPLSRPASRPRLEPSKGCPTLTTLAGERPAPGCASRPRPVAPAAIVSNPPQARRVGRTRRIRAGRKGAQ
jgi:hypothetical protein